MALTDESALRKDQISGLGNMQHRHFATVAAIIADLPAHPKSRLEIAEAFASALRHTNPKFDRERFLRACGET